MHRFMLNQYYSTSLEEALLFPGPTPVLEQVLSRFVLNLRPGSRNTGCVCFTWHVSCEQNLRSHDISPNLIARTTQAILEEFLRTNERSCWWDDVLHRNGDPFAGHDGDIFTLPWDTKVCNSTFALSHAYPYYSTAKSVRYQSCKSYANW